MTRQREVDVLGISGKRVTFGPVQSSHSSLMRPVWSSAALAMWAAVTGVAVTAHRWLSARGSCGQRTALRSLPDYLLHDIGIKRCEIEFGAMQERAQPYDLSMPHDDRKRGDSSFEKNNIR
ncbi:MAG: DUF1127 domain-containing protein [Dongiaceae bacterium]